MKVLSTLMSGILCCSAFSAIASDFKCPSIEALTKFNASGYFSFKLGDLEQVMDQDPEDELSTALKKAWFVSEFKLSTVSADALVTGTYLQPNDKYAFDSINKGLIQLQLEKPSRQKYYDNILYTVCKYSNEISADGSAFLNEDAVGDEAFFLHVNLSNLEQSDKFPELISLIIHSLRDVE